MITTGFVVGALKQQSSFSFVIRSLDPMFLSAFNCTSNTDNVTNITLLRYLGLRLKNDSFLSTGDVSLTRKSLGTKTKE